MTDQLSFRDYATTEYAKHQEEQQLAEQERKVKDQACAYDAVISLLGQKWADLAHFDGTTFTLDNYTINNIKIRAQFDGYSFAGFTVRGTCPLCGTSIYSRACWNIADVGKMLTDFEPNFNHRCPFEPVPATTWQDKLAEAIAEAIEEIYPH